MTELEAERKERERGSRVMVREGQVGGSQLTNQLINQMTFRIHVTEETQTSFHRQRRNDWLHVTSAAPVV